MARGPDAGRPRRSAARWSPPRPPRTRSPIAGQGVDARPQSGGISVSTTHGLGPPGAAISARPGGRSRWEDAARGRTRREREGVRVHTSGATSPTLAGGRPAVRARRPGRRLLRAGAAGGGARRPGHRGAGLPRRRGSSPSCRTSARPPRTGGTATISTTGAVAAGDSILVFVATNGFEDDHHLLGPGQRGVHDRRADDHQRRAVGDLRQARRPEPAGRLGDHRQQLACLVWGQHRRPGGRVRGAGGDGRARPHGLGLGGRRVAGGGARRRDDAGGRAARGRGRSEQPGGQTGFTVGTNGTANAWPPRQPDLQRAAGRAAEHDNRLSPLLRRRGDRHLPGDRHLQHSPDRPRGRRCWRPTAGCRQPRLRRPPAPPPAPPRPVPTATPTSSTTARPRPVPPPRPPRRPRRRRDPHPDGHGPSSTPDRRPRRPRWRPPGPPGRGPRCPTGARRPAATPPPPPRGSPWRWSSRPTTPTPTTTP